MFKFEKYILYLFRPTGELFWLCKNCSKVQKLEYRRDSYTPALGLFNYHVKGKYKCLYQFLLNLTLSVSIRQIFEVLKQRLLLILRGFFSARKFRTKLWNNLIDGASRKLQYFSNHQIFTILFFYRIGVTQETMVELRKVHISTKWG